MTPQPTSLETKITGPGNAGISAASSAIAASTSRPASRRLLSQSVTQSTSTGRSGRAALPQHGGKFERRLPRRPAGAPLGPWRAMRAAISSSSGLGRRDHQALAARAPSASASA